jgi:hypothetical protein
MCRPDAPNSSLSQSAANSSDGALPAPSAPAVAKLVSAAPQPPCVLPPTASTPAASTATNNAQRTAERNLDPYADAGVTASGDSLFAGVALLKGTVPKSDGGVEVLSVSGQIGAQTEVQLGLQRVAGTHGPVSGSVEAFTARANVGIHNDDGSTGFNIAVGATAIGFEGTGTVRGGSSLTYGVAAGMGAGVSVGVRDVDHDGSGELCARVSIGPVTVGACLENPL